MKTFNEWMNEVTRPGEVSEQRFVHYTPERIPHPIILADHVWNECAKVYTLRLDSFLTQIRLMMRDDPRTNAMINSFKEEMVKTMIANSVGFVRENNLAGLNPTHVIVDDPIKESVFTPEGKEAIKKVMKLV